MSDPTNPAPVRPCRFSSLARKLRKRYLRPIDSQLYPFRIRVTNAHARLSTCTYICRSAEWRRDGRAPPMMFDRAIRFTTQPFGICKKRRRKDKLIFFLLARSFEKTKLRSLDLRGGEFGINPRLPSNYGCFLSRASRFKGVV